MQTLGVPARRNLDDAQATQGEAIFYQVGCATCHTPTVTTGTLAGVPSVTNQVIHPYTDLLLHDMGPDLADNRPDFQANGREWRTPPVCGIGLVQTVNGHSEFCTTAVREGKMGSESNFIIPTLLRWNDEIRL